MNKTFLLLLSIFLILSIAQNAKTNKTKKNKEKKEKNNSNKDNKINPQINDEDNKKTAEDGLYMNEATFDEKLKNIIKERNLKPKKKISKDILKQIFNEIYKKDFAIPDIQTDEDSKRESELEAKRFMEEIFEKLTRSLDYDDKIRVSEIKDWISPKRAQEGLNEVMKRLEQMIGEL